MAVPKPESLVPLRTQTAAPSEARSWRWASSAGSVVNAVSDRGPDLRHLGLDRVDRRARAALGPVQRRREDVRADVLGVDLRREPEQRRELVRAGCRSRSAEPSASMSWGSRGMSGLRIGLLAQREQDPLLAGAAIEVVRAVPRPGVAERLGAIHVLDPARDVDPPESAVDRREAIVRDRDLDVDRHPAHRVDDLLEAVEVDLHEVLDVEPVEVAHDRLEPVVADGPVLDRAREEIGAAMDVRPPGVDLAAGRPSRTRCAPDRAGSGTPCVSRGRLNIATCLLTGSIDTTISVSVLNVPSPGRWSAPMSRMLRRSLPFHGGIDTWGTALPAGVSSGTGESVGPAAVPRHRSAMPSPARRRRRVEGALRVRVADEDAAVVEDALGQHVVAGDDDVAAGHHQDDREQARDREGVATEPGPSGSTITRGRRRR